MARFLHSTFGLARRRLWRMVGLAMMLASAVVGGVNLWAWYHYRAAEKAFHDANMEEAEDHISQCLRVWRYGARTHLLAARIDGAAGRYREAERHLADCVRLQHGVREETRLEVVLLRAQSGGIREVEKELWHFVDAGQPQSKRILEAMALVYIQESRLGMALEALSRWIELEPGAARAWHWRGWVREGLMQSEKAIPDHEKAVELEPGRWGSRLRLARLLLNQNNVQSASVHLQELMRSHGDDPDVQVAQARAYMLEGKDEDSTRMTEQVLEAQPHHFEALFLRGQLASQQVPTRDSEEESYMRRALAERPADYRTLHALYMCLKRQGRDKEAAEVRAKQERVEKDALRLQELTRYNTEIAPYAPDVLAEIGELLIRLGDEEKGLLWLSRALRENEYHRRSHEVLFGYYRSRGDTSTANRHGRYLARLGALVPPPTTGGN
jgi:tetratricopeptide (TPR) repeat protein